MSAHLCSTADIHCIVDFCRSIPPRDSLRFPLPPAGYCERAEITLYNATFIDPREIPTAFGRFLLAANWDSLSALYGSRAAGYFGNGHEVATYLARRHPMIVGVLPGKAADELAFVLKQLEHFDYQANEVEDYPNTWAAKVIRHLRREAITRLPGYVAAPWGL